MFGEWTHVFSPTKLAISCNFHRKLSKNYHLSPFFCRHLRFLQKKKIGRRNSQTSDMASWVLTDLKIVLWAESKLSLMQSITKRRKLEFGGNPKTPLNMLFHSWRRTKIQRALNIKTSNVFVNSLMKTSYGNKYYTTSYLCERNDVWKIAPKGWRANESTSA